MAPSQANNYTLSCSKTSNATANSEATSTTNTTFTLSISGTSILKGSAYQCAGIATIPNGITSIEFGAFVPWNQNNSPLTNAYLTSIVWVGKLNENSYDDIVTIYFPFPGVAIGNKKPYIDIVLKSKFF